MSQVLYILLGILVGLPSGIFIGVLLVQSGHIKPSSRERKAHRGNGMKGHCV